MTSLGASTNSYSEDQFKTLKYCPAFLGQFGSIQDVRAFCAEFFEHYNHVHRHAVVGLHTPASVHYGTAGDVRAPRTATLSAAYTANPAPVPAPPTMNRCLTDLDMVWSAFTLEQKRTWRRGAG